MQCYTGPRYGSCCVIAGRRDTPGLDTGVLPLRVEGMFFLFEFAAQNSERAWAVHRWSSRPVNGGESYDPSITGSVTTRQEQGVYRPVIGGECYNQSWRECYHPSMAGSVTTRQWWGVLQLANSGECFDPSMVGSVTTVKDGECYDPSMVGSVITRQ